MSYYRRGKIVPIVDKLRDEYDISIPVNLDELIMKLGGEYEEDDLEYGVSGRVEKGNDSAKFKIIVQRTDIEERKRFSIAHEIGHLFLHMGYIFDQDKWARVGNYTDSAYYRYGHSEEENEAHQFAAELLMPEIEFRNTINELLEDNKVDIVDLAKRFKVSKQAALTRGKWLGIFSWD
jgi:hypothetical protein